MTAMARRRPITSHPAFAPVIALWFAALFGLTVAVLPAVTLESALAGLGLRELTPLTTPVRVGASLAAAALGALLGYAIARALARRAGGDPRPLYADDETALEDASDETPIRRPPLRVREELADGFGDESQVAPGRAGLAPAAMAAEPAVAAHIPAQEGFMILTPQPIHPPRPEPDLDTLLDQFDSAFAAFRAGEESRSAQAQGPRTDPVKAFVARQTGSDAHAPGVSPMGGLVPDHQAELRAALDKLARSQRKE